jgi:hypothetical protein
MDLCTLITVLADSPELSAALGYEGLITYIDLVHLLQPNLSRSEYSDARQPPEHLPLATHDFLRLCLSLDDEMAKLAWATLRHIAWNSDHADEYLRKMTHAHLKYLRLFLEHGSCRGIGMFSLFALRSSPKQC